MQVLKKPLILLCLILSPLFSATLLEEGFEGDFPPSQWQNVAVNGSYTWQQNTGTLNPGGYSAHGGSKVAVYNSYSASSGYSARLITDTIDLSGYTSAELTFWMFHDDGYSGSNDSLVVEIKKRSGGSWPSDWTQLGTFKRYDSSGDAWHQHTIDLSSYLGDSIVISFHAMSAYGNDIHIDDVTVTAPTPNDVGVTGIIPPITIRKNEQDTFGFIVQNFGTQAQSNFYVVFNSNKHPAKDSVMVSSLDSGAVDTIYTAWTPTSAGYDTMTAWTNLSNDQDHSNDTSICVFYVLDSLELLYESFEGSFPPSGWQNIAVSGTYLWQQLNQTEHPSGYSPHTGSYLAGYNSYSASNGNSARLITDTVDLYGQTSARLTFWMFHDNNLPSSNDSLIVEIKKRSGGSWPSDWTQLGTFKRYDASGNSWQKHTVDLSGYTGDSIIIAFRSMSAYGMDIYIDDVRIFLPPPTDVGVTEVIAKSSYHTGSTDTLWFVVKNFGSQAQSGFWVVFQGKLNTAKDSIQITSSLASGAVDTVFKEWTPQTAGYDTVTAWTNLSNDQSRSNDTSSADVLVYGIGYYLFEDFEDTVPPAGWHNESTTGNAWVKSTESRPGAYRGGAMAKYPLSQTSGNYARLVTDTIDLTDAPSANLHFYMYRMSGEPEREDSLVIEIKRRSTKSWPTGWTRLEKVLRYSSTSHWELRRLPLSQYVGDSLIISFTGYSEYGGAIYIDFVEVKAAPDTDIAVRGIITMTKYRAEHADTLKFVVSNYGDTTISSFYLFYHSALGNQTDSTLISSLAKGATDTIAVMWTPQNSGTDTITAWVNLGNDAFRDNDTSRTTAYVWPEYLYIFESFENSFPPEEWSMDTNGISWQRAKKTNSPYGYDPPDGTYLAYFESHSYTSGAWGRLITDTVDLSNDSAATVKFYMFHDSFESDKNDYLVIEVKKRSGGSWPSDWTPVDTVFRWRSTSHWESHSIDISRFIGDSVIIAFKAVGMMGQDIHIDKVEVFHNPTNEVGVVSIVTNGLFHQNQSDSFGLAVRNFGNRSQTDLWVFYRIASLSKSVDSVKIDTLKVRSTDTVFVSWTPASAGYDSIIAWTHLSGDTVTSNDTASAIVNVVEEGKLLSEGFEHDFPPTGWDNQTLLANEYWEKRSQTNQPLGWHPHGGQYMAALWTTLQDTISARLVTPEIDMSSDTIATLQFWFIRDAGDFENADSLIVEIKRYDNSTGWPAGWTVLRRIFRYSAANSWQKIMVPLSEYAGTKIKIGFRGIKRLGNDLHIDDIDVFVPTSSDAALIDVIESYEYRKGHTDSLGFIIANLGNKDLSNLYITYKFSVNYAKAAPESVLVASLPIGAVDTVYVHWTPDTAVTDTLTAWLEVLNDGDRSNDTIVVEGIRVRQENWLVDEDFSRKTHGFPPPGWHRNSDNVEGFYGYVRFSQYSDNDTLSSYQFHLPSTKGPYTLSFRFRQERSYAETLWVYANNHLVARIDSGPIRDNYYENKFVNLSSLAGQDVKLNFIYTRGALVGKNLYLRDIKVFPTPQFDPAAINIVYPTGADTVPAGTTITVRANFANFGTSSGSFNAVAKMYEPNGSTIFRADTTSVSNLGSWDTTLVTFSQWTMRSWNYYSALARHTVRTTAESSSDGNTDNNNKYNSIYVVSHEVHTWADPQWVMKDTLTGASFSWVELTTMNTDSVDTFALGDDGEAWLKLGRAIRINGTLYDSVRIGSNGGIDFNNNEIGTGNTSLPDGTQKVFFAPFWEDLVTASDLNNAPNKLIYTRVWDDSTVIEWYNVEKYGSNLTFTFEVIIYTPPGGHGNIKFQYNGMSNYSASSMDATIGFQLAGWDDNKAATYTFDESPFVPNWSQWAILLENPETNPANKDLSVVSVAKKLAHPHVGDTDTVTVIVENVGVDTVPSYSVVLELHWQSGGGKADTTSSIDTMVINTFLKPRGIDTLRFRKFLDTLRASLHRTYYLAKILYANDQNPSNDTAKSSSFYTYRGQYNMHFDDLGDPYPVRWPGWSSRDFRGGGRWRLTSYSSTTQGESFDGSNALGLYNDPYDSIPEYGGYDDWLLLPGILPDTLREDFIAFMAKTWSPVPDTLFMWVDTTSNKYFTHSYAFKETTFVVTDQWKHFRALLDKFNGKPVKIGLQYKKRYNQEGSMFIDCVDMSKKNDILAPAVIPFKMPHNHYYTGTQDTIIVNLSDENGVDTSTVMVWYRTRTDSGQWSSWQYVRMKFLNEFAPNVFMFRAALPAFSPGTDVQYRIVRQDTLGNSATTATFKYRIVGNAPKDEHKDLTFLTRSSPSSWFSKEIGGGFESWAYIMSGGYGGIYDDEPPSAADSGDFFWGFVAAFGPEILRSMIDSLPKHRRVILSNYLNKIEKMLNDPNSAWYIADSVVKALELYQRLGGKLPDKGKDAPSRRTVILMDMDWAEFYRDSALLKEVYRAKFIQSDLSSAQDDADTLMGIPGDPITNGMPNIIVEYQSDPDMMVPWGYECVTASGDTVIVDSGWRFMTVKNGDSTNTAGGIAYVGVARSLYFIPFNFGFFKDTTLIDTLFNRIIAFDSTASPPNVIDWCKIEPPYRDTVEPGDNTDTLHVLVYEQGLTNLTGMQDSIVVEVGYGPRGDFPDLSPNWRWFRTYFDGKVDTLYRYKGVIPVVASTEPGYYDFSFRISVRKNSGKYEAFYYADTVGHEDSLNYFTYQYPGELWVSMEHDIACDSIKNVSEGDTIFTGSQITPSAYVHNFGRNQESFKVYCFIFDTTAGDTVYRDTLNFTSIPADTSFWTNFETWSPSNLHNRSFRYLRMVIFSDLISDQYRGDDTVSVNFNLFTHEVRDSGGMICRDNNSGVSYNWIELTGGKDGVDTLKLGDDGSAWVHFGKTFYYYGRAYDSVMVTSNGVLSFSQDPGFANVELPDIDHKDLIAPFWEDLFVKSSVSGGSDSLVYARVWPDSTVIEWKGVSKVGENRPMTFEVMFKTPGNADRSYIKFQYRDMSRYDEESFDATIGVQDSAGAHSKFIQYTYNETPYTPNWSESGKKSSGSFERGKEKGGWAIMFATSEATGVGEEVRLPQMLFLSQNLPNPFVRTTVIRFGLPTAGDVSLKVYNILGQRVATLVDRRLNAGYHEVRWNGSAETGSMLRAGVYFYILKFEGRVLRRKMMILR